MYPQPAVQYEEDNEYPAVQHEQDIEYPESDGLPMADNTKQFRWITTLVGNLQIIFKHDPNVFVAGDLLWYPVKGRPEIRRAPDAMTVHGRPKGDRGSYRQWEEGGIPPQVVFEVLSPSNTAWEMRLKRAFYDKYGVEEFYSYDPDNYELQGWIRRTTSLDEIIKMNNWSSPRLGIRFEIVPNDLRIYTPQGKPFLTFEELDALREQAEKLHEQEKLLRLRAEKNEQKARKDAEKARKDAEKALRESLEARKNEEQARKNEEQARKDAEQARKDAERERLRAEKLAEQLRKLGIDTETS